MSELFRLGRSMRHLSAMQKQAFVGRLALKGTQGLGKLMVGAVKRPMTTLGIGGTALGVGTALSQGAQKARMAQKGTSQVLRRRMAPYGYEGGMF